MTHRDFSVPTPRFGLGRFDRIRVGNIDYRFLKSVRDAMTLVRWST